MATHRLGAACIALLLVVAISGSSSTMLEEEGGVREAHVEAVDAGGYRTYIVMVEPPAPPAAEVEIEDFDAHHRAWHQSFLPSERTSLGEPRLRWSYRTVFNGFSARLTKEELKQVSSKPGFVRSFPNVIYYLQTTRTPAFLGLPNRMGESPDNWPGAGGRGMIIGVVDSGIDDEHPSLNDDGFGGISPPDHWSGSCYPDFRCNSKLIGAKNIYDPGYPPLDGKDGHGTHTATTAAGNFVAGVSYNGVAGGNASGVAPYAHLAVYKACGGLGGNCSGQALVGAIDEAVKDGVDVISLSIGIDGPPTFDHDPIAIATFSAVRRGVHVVAAAGNFGPAPSTVRNVAPWLLTVGAGTVDRSFTAAVNIDGNYRHGGDHFRGESLADRKRLPPMEKQDFLYRGEYRHFCFYPPDERHLIRDRIVICDAGLKTEVQAALIGALMSSNASAIVLVAPKQFGYTIPLPDLGADRPVVHVPYEQGLRLKDYASGPLPQGSIDFGAGTEVPFSPAPTVACFSGRGPSKLSPGVLKPDVLAPGVNILAGVPFAQPGRDFGFMSGTSMAAPHVSGLVALLKKQHPTWSPAIIRSALMTTADLENNNGKRIQDENWDQQASLYATGAGHVNVSRATDPGLAYDLGEADYTSYLCNVLGEEAMRVVFRNDTAKCSDYQTLTHEYQLNYPSIVVNIQQEPNYAHVPRTLTNLVAADGLPELYTVEVDMPWQVFVDVDPEELNFTSPGQKISYTLNVAARYSDNPVKEGVVFQGSITWSSSRGHVVRSPMLAVVGLPAPKPSTAWNLDV